MKVLLATEKPFNAKAVASIRSVIENAGFELSLLEKYTQKSDLLSAVAGADGLIIRSDIVDQEVMDSAKKLKIVVRAGAGYDNVDLATASQKGIVVMNTPGQNANAVAELVFGMLIYYLRHFFSGKSGSELRDKKLGVHGYGHIGRRVAAIAKGFGMSVYAHSPSVPPEMMEKDGVTRVEKVEDLYQTCQFVSVHVPARKASLESINYALMSRMPEGAVVVNTARTEVINEADLLKVFAERSDFGFVADVAPKCAAEISEKYPDRHYFTPKKMGAQTAEANVNAGIAAAKQIRDFFKNGDVTFQVNK